MKSAASRVKLARRAAGLTQAGLAERLGVSRSAISQWERVDGSNPTAANLGNLALALACSFEWLATGRGSKSAGSKFSRSEPADTAVQLRYFAKDDGEEHLLAAFRDLDHWDQKAVLSVVDTLAHREKRPGPKAGKRKHNRPV
jgi:transcriptional regulator with XRE-family HTH domain